MEWNKVMNFGDPSTFGTEMADRFVASGANLPPPLFQIGLMISVFEYCFGVECKECRVQNVQNVECLKEHCLFRVEMDRMCRKFGFIHI